MLQNKLFIVSLLGLSLVAGGAAIAKPSPDVKQLVKERQQGFKNMGKSMKALGKNLKKKDKADYAAMLKAAETILAESKQLQARFPKGSGPETGLKMEALASIWAPQSDFQAIADKLSKDSAKLATVISNKKSYKAVMKQVRAVKKSCGSCHDSYKAD